MQFSQYVKIWAEESLTRKREPLRLSTITKDLSYLNNHVLCYIGEMELEEIGPIMPSILRTHCVEHWQHLSVNTQEGILKAVSHVLHSCYTEQGGYLYPFKWNRRFLDLPKNEQLQQPAYSSEECAAIIHQAWIEAKQSDYRLKHYVLYRLLAGTGIRIGEALALRTNDITPDGRQISINKSLYQGEVGEPKSKAAYRIVDTCAELAGALEQYRTYLGGDFRLFNVSHQSIYKWSLRPILEKLGIPYGRGEGNGFHGFRRYRATVLQLNGVPEILISYWLGWKPSQSMLSHYSHAVQDVEWRTEYADKVGMGF
jgi:integrase